MSILLESIRTLIDNQMAASNAGGDVSTRLRRTVEAHVRYHAAHRSKAYVCNRELSAIELEHRKLIGELRDAYEHGLRGLIEKGCSTGEFSVPSAKLVTFAILEMGVGVSVWFRPDGELSVGQVAYAYTEMALRMATERSPVMVSHRPDMASSVEGP